jgi:hypothetical protein
MKREIELSEEEYVVLMELLEQDQDRLNAEISRAGSQERHEQLRRRSRVTRDVVDALSREPSQVWCDELLAWCSPPY